MGSNAILFGAVGTVYTGGKCIAEGLSGEKSPLNSAVGGALAGATLGVYTKKFTVLIGASLGLAVLSVIGEINGNKMVHDKARFDPAASDLSKRFPKAFGLRKAES